MSVVHVEGVSYRYGRTIALDDLSFNVPEGSVYALLGPNGSGKTTLLQILMGLRKPRTGAVSLMGIDGTALRARDRARIGYIAEGQQLPGWMRLEQLEAFLAPLYPTWDFALAKELRTRLDLDPKQKIKTLSRGQSMKAAMLCALAPRPKLVLMDEPFTGMDVVVRDELVRGLLDSASNEGWTAMLCSHDIGEIEMLADWVGFLDHGRMRISEPMDSLRSRFAFAEVVLGDSQSADRKTPLPNWLSFEQSNKRLTFLLARNALEQAHTIFPDARIETREPTLRELFVALAKSNETSDSSKGVA